MQAPLFARPLTEKVWTTIEVGRRSSEDFTVQCCQMLLASADGQPPTIIARLISCTDQTVRNAIHDFYQRGLATLHPKSSRPHTIHVVFDSQGHERLRALPHQSPRTFGKDTSIGTLELVAEVSVTVGIANRQINGETTRRISPCLLPSKSPWLHPIESRRVHGKRNVSEADRILSADELETRVCPYYSCPREPHLVMPQRVA